MDTNTRRKSSAHWSGIWYVNIGDADEAKWNERRKYRFITAGGGEQYTKPLDKLKIGDRLYAYMKPAGYVGFGKVWATSKRATEFRPENESRPLGELLPSIRDGKADYAVGVDWIDWVHLEDAKRRPGLFASRHIVCELNNVETLNYLKGVFRER